MPSTKVGVAIPIAVNPESAASRSRFRQIALSEAASSANVTPRTKAVSESWSVGKIRSFSRVVTGYWLKYDSPKLPCSIPATQRSYCTGSEWSRPS